MECRSSGSEVLLGRHTRLVLEGDEAFSQSTVGQKLGLCGQSERHQTALLCSQLEHREVDVARDVAFSRFGERIVVYSVLHVGADGAGGKASRIVPFRRGVPVIEDEEIAACEQRGDLVQPVEHRQAQFGGLPLDEAHAQACEPAFEFGS